MRISSKMFNSMFFGATILVAASCSTPLKVSSDYDKSVNFSNYKTFSVYNLKTTGSVSQLNAERITNAIRTEMTKKGFTETNNNNADLLVNAVIILKDKQQTTATSNFYGYGSVYRPYGYYGGMPMGGSTTVSTYEYKAGTFVIDVVDNKTQKLVWEGTGNKDIDSKPKNPDETIKNGVAKIMEGFPPGLSKK
ncbi:MAG: DUF4136 domain-containing protein [Ferruginibacter sp.]